MMLNAGNMNINKAMPLFLGCLFLGAVAVCVKGLNSSQKIQGDPNLTVTRSHILF